MFFFVLNICPFNYWCVLGMFLLGFILPENSSALPVLHSLFFFPMLGKFWQFAFIFLFLQKPHIDVNIGAFNLSQTFRHSSFLFIIVFFILFCSSGFYHSLSSLSHSSASVALLLLASNDFFISVTELFISCSLVFSRSLRHFLHLLALFMRPCVIFTFITPSPLLGRSPSPFQYDVLPSFILFHHLGHILLQPHLV